MYTIRTILHPTDFSDRSEFAFEVACSLAHVHGARIVVLHVLPPDMFPGMDALPVDLDVERERAWREEMIRRQSCHPEVPIEYRMEEGDPVTRITEIARERDCDLIVLGTHGRTGLSRLFRSSVAEQVLRSASCPVLTVKEPVTEAIPESVTREERVPVPV